MKPSQKLAALAEQELPKLLDHVIVADGEKYRVFGSYVLRQTAQGYTLTYQDRPVGTFTSTRSAVAWCIADKNQSYALARDLFNLDQKLGYITDDIAVRAAIGDRSTRPQFREDIEIKLEGKIILKKQLELALAKCVNQAKYYQQRGLDNETARTGRKPNKTSR